MVCEIQVLCISEAIERLYTHALMQNRNTDDYRTYMTKCNKRKIKIACRDDWKTEPMPKQHETFVLRRSFSDAEMNALRCGNIPQAMEDKWFWYMEGWTLFAHRSWTDYCVYRIDFKKGGKHSIIRSFETTGFSGTGIKRGLKE